MRGPVAKLLEQPITKMEQPIGAALLERISWDDLRVFVVVARTLSFRKAATALRTSTSTVMRCVERLEKIFEFRLFDRLHDGLGLTEKGQRVYQSAQEMERASHSLRAHLDQDLNLRGIVRCSVTEGLGTCWILPQLAQFSRTHPATIVRSSLRDGSRGCDAHGDRCRDSARKTEPARREERAARAHAHLSIRIARIHRNLRGAEEH